MKKSHGDSWLFDFRRSPSSAKAKSALLSSILANHTGKTDDAVKEARLSRDLFMQTHNKAGAARSEFEVVYALHRGSHARECTEEIPKLQTLLTGRDYHWLEIQLLLEFSSCRGMLTDFDSASTLATKAITRAKKYNFPILNLRAQGFQASLNTVEGRFRQSWQANSLGLSAFWSAPFPPDRGFQFYSDLELAAERSNEWNLAVILQREVLAMLNEAGRSNLAALAHFRLIGLLESIGDLPGAKSEIKTAEDIFRAMPPGEQKDLYKSYSEVMTATIFLQNGDIDAATKHLQAVNTISLDQWDNFNLHLRYLKVAAEIAHHNTDPAEQHILTDLVALGDSGFTKLHSPKDRWDWDREIGPEYRRLLELDTLQPNDAELTLADWENYRGKASSGSYPAYGPPIHNLTAKTLLNSKIRGLKNSTVLTFAILPGSMVVWVADNRGVQQFSLSINQFALKKEIRQFHLLCSDPKSSIQKVNYAGSRLYGWLLAPIEKALDPQRTLFIEADEFMGLLPWAALVMKNGTYLGESFTIANSPGIFFAANPHTNQANVHVLIAEPGAVQFEGERYIPLPHATEEAENIVQLYHGATYVKGRQVTSEVLLRKLPKSSIFQFAGHAVNREYGGELLVHDKSGTDTTLSASSLSNLRLEQTKLVVLSACSTAFNDKNSMTSPHGLVSAFLAAGVESVIASQWDVDSSSTADLMVHFHKLHQGGYSTSKALRLAQHSMLSDPRMNHPYFWASFAEFEQISKPTGSLL
jgi:CHAT domain-containing protein